MAKYQIGHWINQQLDERGWKQADLARASGLDTGYISRIVNEERPAGPDACIAIARAFDLPPEYVFRIAGILPDGPQVRQETQEIAQLFDQLSDDDQQDILIMIRALVREKVRNFGRKAQTRSSEG